MTLDDILFDAEEKMDAAVEHMKQQFKGIRTGRASTGLVDGMRIEVESYGSTMTLKELANIGIAENNTIMIKPFDPSTLKDIERAISKSELGINPQSDGKLIRLPVPPLSTERRNQLVSQVKSLAEAQKVAIRNVRRDANKSIETAEKAKTMTEDEKKKGQERVQKLTDDYTASVEKALEEKTKEITTV